MMKMSCDAITAAVLFTKEGRGEKTLKLHMETWNMWTNRHMQYV